MKPQRTLTINYKINRITIVDGKTMVSITDTDTGAVYYGYAKCNEADGFDYEIGVNIATRRAVIELFKNNMEFDNMVDGNDLENCSYVYDKRVAY